MLLASHNTSFPIWIALGLAFTFATIVSHQAMSGGGAIDGPRPRPLRWIELLPYAGFLGTILVLAVTSFYSVLRFGAMHQWYLLAHLGAAGAFVFLLLIVTAIWAPQSQFGSKTQSDSPFWWLSRVTFWLMIVSGIVTSVSMLIGMLPIFSTGELLTSVNVHRFAGLFLVVITSLHCYSLAIRAKYSR